MNIRNRIAIVGSWLGKKKMKPPQKHPARKIPALKAVVHPASDLIFFRDRN